MIPWGIIDYFRYLRPKILSLTDHGPFQILVEDKLAVEFVRPTLDQLEFNDAKTMCDDLGMELLTLRSENKSEMFNTWLTTEYPDYSYFNPDRYI